MKTYKFNNGETRLESQIREGVDFKTTCILWGCFEKGTGEPLPYTTYETTDDELIEEKNRLAEIREDYEDVCENNDAIAKGNEKLANATNIDEFLNAYL